MLTLQPGNTYSERIFIRSPRPGVVCWISYKSIYNPEMLDWELFVKRRNEPVFSRKCPLRLEVESRLRAWMLRVHRRPLASLRYAQLRAVALSGSTKCPAH